MNYDEVVDLIVEEVYRKINSFENSNSPLKKVAIAMKEDGISDITKILGSDYKIVVYDNEDIECDIVIISSLSLRTMANLAALTTSREDEDFILRMLMLGKEVYVLEDGLEYRKYKNTAPRALYSKYLDFEKQLKIYGIRLISYLGEIKTKEKILLKGNLNNNHEITNEILDSESKIHLKNKKVINEAEIKKILVSGIETILIDKKSIITPLAADFIKTHNLRIERV